MEAKAPSKAIEHLKNKLYLRIYQRMNETFFVTKSYFWRLQSPSGKMLFYFETSQLFLQSSQISLFSLDSFGQSEVPSQEIENYFSLFVSLRTT